MKTAIHTNGIDMERLHPARRAWFKMLERAKNDVCLGRLEALAWLVYEGAAIAELLVPGDSELVIAFCKRQLLKRPVALVEYRRDGRDFYIGLDDKEHYLGVDITPRMIDWARERAGAGLPPRSRLEGIWLPQSSGWRWRKGCRSAVRS